MTSHFLSGLWWYSADPRPLQQSHCESDPEEHVALLHRGEAKAEVGEECQGELQA